MIEICLVELHDCERAAEIVKLALAHLPDQAQRIELLRVHRTLRSRAAAISPAARLP